MEKKKNERYDLQRKSPLFFFIGLACALSMVMVAFEWKSQYDPVVIEVEDPDFPAFDFIPNTIIEEPKPPQPKALTKPKPKPAAVKKIIESDQEIADLKKAIEIEPVDNPTFIVEAPTMEDENVDQPFIIVQDMPSYPGGIEAFYDYVGRNMKYPKMARRHGIQGTVTLQFVIDVDGSITDIQVLKGIGGGCDEEAIRVLFKAKKFSPGKQRGMAVKVRQTLPIFFRLR
ncbi:MAG: energy transducer TonB [Cyclobacteriaceae bacterium]|nr:energy transducer TonB [Cyclobacteriaceae bacterium HetDA_MAG_MS6]